MSFINWVELIFAGLAIGLVTFLYLCQRRVARRDRRRPAAQTHLTVVIEGQAAVAPVVTTTPGEQESPQPLAMTPVVGWTQAEAWDFYRDRSVEAASTPA